MTRFLPETGQRRIPRMNRSESDHVTGQKTGFETISLQLNDHTDRGVGGRQYGTLEETKTLQG
jgi:hypothetical protein